MPDAPTPSMQQYLKAKAEHPECIVLFRMGDFYETFFEDAISAASILDIALTSRNKDAPNPIPMAGVPHHAIAGYISKLISAGQRVAICEQMEDPKFAKGVVKREVVRVITPGVLLDTEMTDPNRANHLACIVSDERGYALVAVEASTGDFSGVFVTSPDTLTATIQRLDIRELLLPDDSVIPPTLAVRNILTARISAEDMDPAKIDEKYRGILPGADHPPTVLRAATAVLVYLQRTHKALMTTLRSYRPLPIAQVMTLTETTVRNLEILETSSGGRARGSLLTHLDRTRTSMGSRRLRELILAPMTDIESIKRRQERVESLFSRPAVRALIRDDLNGIPDIERTLTRLAGGSCNARDLNSLARGIRAMETVSERIKAENLIAIADLSGVETGIGTLAHDIEATFVPDPPTTTKDGGMVRKGVNRNLDSALEMAENSHAVMARYETELRQRTGISSLRIRYNRVFGYTIEVSKGQIDRVPSEFSRRQTLTTGERYTTPQLSELEQAIGVSEEKSTSIQSEIFESFRQRTLSLSRQVQVCAGRLALIDVVAALADIAHQENWTRPALSNERQLNIVQGRHPIVMSMLPSGTFVPNDFVMDGVTTSLTIITGPNMAGKSTVMRQVALIVLLAQIGSFVPAESAEIGIADAIFTRVGAMDDIAAGRSTFMVEMAEAAEMLARATDRSLVILDEIGRGTSTFDGVAIAWAVAEHIQEKIGCRTLFATHYHELTDLVRTIPRTRNQSIAVKEWGGEVLFLRKLVDGPASKSYGIQVARLAGLPDSVIGRAKEVLANLEASELDVIGEPVIARAKGRARATRGAAQLDMFGSATPVPDDPLLDELAGVDPNRLTPVEAIQVLFDFVEKAKLRRK